MLPDLERIVFLRVLGTQLIIFLLREGRGRLGVDWFIPGRDLARSTLLPVELNTMVPLGFTLVSLGLECTRRVSRGARSKGEGEFSERSPCIYNHKMFENLGELKKGDEKPGEEEQVAG